MIGMTARLEGNLTKNPEGRVVTVDGEKRQLVELRVFCDVNRQVDGEWVQDEERSTGVDVTIWPPGLGEVVLKTLKKGARVIVEGELRLNEYVDAEGTHHAGLRCSATSVSLLPYRVEAITFAPRKDRPESEGGHASRDRASV